MAFGELTIRFDDRVLRPRPWTVAQSLWAAELAATAPSGPILELCAGAGHIGLHLASLTGRALVQVDADAAACELARDNAAALDADVRVEVRHGPVDAVLRPEERFALALADPPWVPSADTARYPDDPVSAIDGGADGLGPARRCVETIARHLATGGAGVLQLGTEHQAACLRAHLATRTDLDLRLDEVRAVEGANGVLARLLQ